MTIGQRGGRYTDGWKNISVHKSYDDALEAREELAAIAALRERLGEKE